MKKLLLLSGLSAALLVACGSGGTNPPPEEEGGTGNPPPTSGKAYAVTFNALYEIGLSSSGSNEQKADLSKSGYITDMVLTGGTLYAISTNSLLQINPSDGTVQTIGAHGDGGLNALGADANGNLYAASVYGKLFSLSRSTGKLSFIGELGVVPSGDLAFNAAGQLYGIVVTALGAADQLARIDPRTGKATPIGPLGSNAVYGIEFHGGVLYGVSPNGGIFTIDTATGAATLLRQTNLNFTGM